MPLLSASITQQGLGFPYAVLAYGCFFLAGDRLQEAIESIYKLAGTRILLYDFQQDKRSVLKKTGCAQRRSLIGTEKARRGKDMT
jgi:hypothetical protein